MTRVPKRSESAFRNELNSRYKTRRRPSTEIPCNPRRVQTTSHRPPNKTTEYDYDRLLPPATTITINITSATGAVSVHDWSHISISVVGEFWQGWSVRAGMLSYAPPNEQYTILILYILSCFIMFHKYLPKTNIYIYTFWGGAAPPEGRQLAEW